MSTKISRRRVLHGMLGGAAISVGLPLLDCFLDDNGTALADGAPLPTCFGTWFASMGFTPTFWEPEVVGPKFQMKPMLKVLEPFQQKMNLFSGLEAFLDGRPMATHETGAQITTSGSIPVGKDIDVPSLDQLVANTIGTRTRFRSLEVSYEGVPTSWSRRSSTSINASEVSPLALYRKIFGPEYADPNSDKFTPDPAVMLERSVLSTVSDQRASLAKNLGASDRVRLDEYFTSLRELEHELDVQLQKPMPMVACTKPDAPMDGPHGQSMDLVVANGKLFSQLLAHALACGQTRVFNAVATMGASSVHKSGSQATFHIDTHEEAIDPTLGYQPETHWYMARCLDCLADLLTQLDGVREGDRTLLDRTVLYTSTDHGYARLHTLTNIPLMTAGGANGRLKTGYHLSAPGDTTARVGLTVAQALQLPVSSWGTMSNETSKPFTDLLA